MLYQQIANEIALQIKNGQFQADDKLPGVRKLSALFQVSVSTIIQAHQILEDQGLIEAKSRSGYYVQAQLAPLASPTTSKPKRIPQLVTGQALVLELLKAANHPSILPLGAAVPHSSFLPLKTVRHSMQSVIRQHSGKEHKLLDYLFPPGDLSLRQQIAKRMRLARCACHVDDIVITNGCQEALNIAFKSVVKPGGIIAIESPVFYGLLQVIESLGMRALEISTDPQQGMDLDALESAIKRWPIEAVAVVANFSNPLGYCMPDEKKKSLVALLAKSKIPLIEDDVYGELGFSTQYRQSRPTALKAYDKSNSVIYCSSFSKSIAPGLRVGWIIPGKNFAQAEFNKYVTNLATPALPQLALADFIAKGLYDRYLKRVKEQYQAQVSRVTHFISQYFPPGTKITQPLGGFVVWVELPRANKSMLIYKAAIKKNISIAPGPIFSASGRYANFIRISCAQPWDKKMEEGLKTLGTLIKT